MCVFSLVRSVKAKFSDCVKSHVGKFEYRKPNRFYFDEFYDKLNSKSAFSQHMHCHDSCHTVHSYTKGSKGVRSQTLVEHHCKYHQVVNNTTNSYYTRSTISHWSSLDTLSAYRLLIQFFSIVNFSSQPETNVSSVLVYNDNQCLTCTFRICKSSSGKHRWFSCFDHKTWTIVWLNSLAASMLL